jgi:hypothetical protein
LDATSLAGLLAAALVEPSALRGAWREAGGTMA